MSANVVSLSKIGSSQSSKIAKKMFAARNTKITKKLSDFRKNAEWLANKRETLRKEYGNMYVAIYNRKVCHALEDPNELLTYVKKHYGDDQAVVVNYIGKRRVKFLL